MKGRTRAGLLVLVALAAAVAGYLLLVRGGPATAPPASHRPRVARAVAAATTPRPAAAPAPSGAAPAADGGAGAPDLAMDGTVTVTVHAPDGGPAPGADVHLTWHGAPRGRPMGGAPFYREDIPPIAPVALPGGGMGPDLDAAAGGDGTHVFHVHVAGYYEVMASPPVGPSAGAYFGIDAAHPKMAVDLTLVAVAALGIQVVDPSGAPIAGAELRKAAWGPAGDPVAVTDASGRASLEVPKDGGTKLRITATGRAPVTRRFGPNGPRRVVLEAAPTVSGTVVADGAPVAGATVSWPFHPDCPPATTGADGTFTLHGLAREVLQLEARKGARYSAEVTVDARKAKVTGVVLTLRDPETLAVRVVDREGDAVSDARVRLGWPGSAPPPPPPGTAPSPWLTWHPVDAHGRLSITPVPDAPLMVQAEAPDRPRVSQMFRTAPGVQKVRVVLPEGTPVTVTVLDPAGHPFTGQHGQPAVTVARADGMGQPFAQKLPLPDGRQSVQPVVGPGRWAFGAEVPGEAVVEPKIVTEPGTDQVTLQAIHGAELTGRVVGPGGSGIPGLSLLLTPTGGTAAFRGYAGTGDGGHLTSTGPVAPGTYRISFIMSGRHWRIPRGTVVRAGAGPQTVTLKPAGTIEGDLLDARGHRVPFVELRLVRAGTPKRTFTGNSGTTGHFVVGHLMPGTYAITVPRAPRPPKPVTARTGARNVVIRLPRQPRGRRPRPPGGSGR